MGRAHVSVLFNNRRHASQSAGHLSLGTLIVNVLGVQTAPVPTRTPSSIVCRAVWIQTRDHPPHADHRPQPPSMHVNQSIRHEVFAAEHSPHCGDEFMSEQQQLSIPSTQIGVLHSSISSCIYHILRQVSRPRYTHAHRGWH